MSKCCIGDLAEVVGTEVVGTDIVGTEVVGEDIVGAEVIGEEVLGTEVAQKWILKLTSKEGANDFAGFEERHLHFYGRAIHH